jgi:hypothetical protein
MKNENLQINNIMLVSEALSQELEKFVFVGGSICPLLMENKNGRNDGTSTTLYFQSDKRSSVHRDQSIKVLTIDFFR